MIANAAYLQQPLLNPSRDAEAVAAALERVGFRVTRAIDQGRLAMEDAALAFAEAASGADVSFVYYSGHGVQVDGVNYLVPVDAQVKDTRELRRLIRLDQLVEDASGARQVAIVVVDACRDNPFEENLTRSLGASRSAGLGRGLAPYASRLPGQTLIAYAADAGQVAYDGPADGNSPFAAALSRHLAEPDLELGLLFRKVGDEVQASTQGQQRPTVYGRLGGAAIYLARSRDDARELDAALDARELLALQRSLGRLGYYAGPADGRRSGGLRAAVRDFQLARGEAATGYLDLAQTLALHREARAKRTVEPLPTMALVELFRRSEAGEREAQRARGMFHDPAYAAGPLPKDADEAARWYRKAAEVGDAPAALRLADLLRARDDPAHKAEATAWLERAAGLGDVGAILALADAAPAGDARVGELLARAAADPEGGEAVARLRGMGRWPAGR